MKKLWTHLLVLAFLLGPMMSTAHAQDTHVRVLHALSLGSKVDVYIDGKKIFNDLEFASVTQYRDLPAGYHTFQIRTNYPPRTIVSISRVLRPGNFYTLGFYGTPRRQRLLFANDSAGDPAYARARLTTYHLSPGLPAFDVVAFLPGGRILTLIRNVGYGRAKSAYIPAIPMTVRLVRNRHILKTRTGVRPLPGRRYAAYALGRPSRNFKLLLDPTASQ